MTKQEIVNQLASRQNFKDVLKICLDDNLEINQYDCFPGVVVYINESEYYEKETGEFKDKGGWITIDIKNDGFEVDGVIMSGVRNFFINYKKITKFYLFDGDFTLKVIPNLTGKGNQHWYISDDYDHFEISYDCHSFSGYAYENKDDKRYYIEGDRFHKEDWIKISREVKFLRIENKDFDYNAYRIEQKEKRKKAIEEELKNRQKNQVKSDEYTTYDFTQWA